MSGQILDNWGRTAKSRPDDVAVPVDRAALIDVIRTAAGPPARRVRPMGHRHSVNYCFEADGGVQVDMSRFGVGEAPVVNAEARTITVKAGATLLEVRDALRAHGLELPVSPEIGNATAGSVACAGTKDGSLRGRAPGIGQIASSVIKLEIVDAAGTPRTIQGPALQAYRSSHGLMGIVYEVTFQAVQRELLQIEYEWLRLDPLPSIGTVFARPGGNGRADGVLAFIQAYDRRLLVERRTRLGAGASPPSGRDRLKRAIRDWIWEWGQTAVVTKAAGLDAIAQLLFAALPSFTLGAEVPPAVVSILQDLLDGVLDHVAAIVPIERQTHRHVPEIVGLMETALPVAARAAFPLVPWDAIAGALIGHRQEDVLLALADRTPVLLEVLAGYRAHRSDSMIDFGPGEERWPYVFDFTFWAFPQSRWAAIVRDYMAFCATFYAETGYRPSIFSEVYFIDRDQHSWLSFSPDEPIFTINMVDSPRLTGGTWDWDPRWFEMNRRFNLWAVATDAEGQPRRGRPILNQTKVLETTPAVLGQAFGQAWTDFVNQVRQQDRAGRFRSNYFTALGV